MVHQSNAYFEQCHAADFDSTVTPELRRQCWARWLQHYTYGQPPDRVEYARARIAALEDGEEIEPLPGMSRAAVDGSYTASFFTPTAAVEHPEDDRPEPEPGAEGDGPQADTSEAAAGDEAAGATAVAEEAETDPAARTAVWERPGRRVIQPQREFPEPPNTQGACARVCTPRWNVCIRRCDDRPESCREACETEHRTCMRGCF